MSLYHTGLADHPLTRSALQLPSTCCIFQSTDHHMPYYVLLSLDGLTPIFRMYTPRSQRPELWTSSPSCAQHLQEYWHIVGLSKHTLSEKILSWYVTDPKRNGWINHSSNFLYSFHKDNWDLCFVAVYNSVILCSQILKATATFTAPNNHLTKLMPCAVRQILRWL